MAGRMSSARKRAQDTAKELQAAGRRAIVQTSVSDVEIAAPKVSEIKPSKIAVSGELVNAARRRPRKPTNDAPNPLSGAADYNPFALPKPPPGVGPKPDSARPNAPIGMAADEAICGVTNWAAQSIMSSAYAEGQVFLGYAELSILAQRPEYRVVSEEIASEMTREWIEFESVSRDDEIEEEFRGDLPPSEGLAPEAPGTISAPGSPGTKSPAGTSATGGTEMPLPGMVPSEPPVDPVEEEIKTAKAEAAKGKVKRIKELEDEIEALDLKTAMNHVAEYDGFMGRAHLYLDTGDTDDEDELKTSIGDGKNLVSRTKVRKGKLKGIRPVEAVWVYPTDYESNDPLKKDWYTPDMWYVMGKQVHHTRLLTFVGREVPDMLKPAYSFGGLSMTQMIKPYVDNWLRTRQSISDMVKSYSVSGLKTNLGTATMPGGGGDLFNRIDFMNALRDNRGALVLDKESEEWFQIATPLSTLDALQAQSQEHMASVSRIPIVKLLGIQPAGLNASSEGEITAFYDWIAAYQEKFFKKHLTTIIHMIMLSLWDEIDESITWKFKPLKQLTELEEMELETKKTDIDDKNVAMGAIDPAEVRKRVVNDKASQYHGLQLDADATPQPAPEMPMMGEPPPEELDAMGGEPLPEELSAAGEEPLLPQAA